MKILMDYRQQVEELEESVFGGPNMWQTHPQKLTYTMVVLVFLHCRWLRVLTADRPDLNNLLYNFMDDFNVYYRSKLNKTHPIETQAHAFKMALLLLAQVCPLCGHPGECSVFCRRCKFGLPNNNKRSNIKSEATTSGEKVDNPAYHRAMDEYNKWKAAAISGTTTSQKEFLVFKKWKTFPFKRIFSDTKTLETQQPEAPPSTACPFSFHCLDQSKISNIYVEKYGGRR